jgi:hypothetical protein
MRRAKNGMSPGDVQVNLGPPSTKSNHGGLEIWSYDLRRYGATHYSIRVAFADQKVCQTYIGMDMAPRPYE